MVTRIDTVAARGKLKTRREPYWHRVRKGCFVGFRKMSATGGGWMARARDDGPADAKQFFHPLGDFSDIADHLRFDAATKAAFIWFDHIERGGQAGPTTVRVACSRYVDHVRTLKGEKAAKDAEQRFDNYVLNDKKLAETNLAKLTPSQVGVWRDSLISRPTKSGPNRGQRRSDSTLNRDLTPFRAALNLAFEDGLVTTDFAWRTKLRPIKGADRSRDLYLDRGQRQSFLTKAPVDLAAFIRGMCQVPLRPGAVAALDAGGWDRRLKVLKLGKDKSGRDRRIKMPDVVADHFDAATKDKLPTAPMFTRFDGKRWDKDAWKWPIKETVKAAGLPPGTTAYTFRHSVITDLVVEGLDLLTIAQISGTSVVMIERHYGHLRGDVASAALARVAV
ncbi:tyrosine-type recombinase/integrase [Roseateles sp. LYH14W]|uniref:Tyrosine-type recombinase/integrase n=1 Tax=Pelomonas parva TaxID=3299032 RepID=A0ABW7FCK4_9BURK